MRGYLDLMKLRVVELLLVSTLPAMVLAAKGLPDFGLAFATFLTLILVPCMYLLGDVNSKLIKGWFKKKPAAVDVFTEQPNKSE